MSSESSHVIEAQGNGVEFHVLVLKSQAPEDDVIKKIIRQGVKNGYLTEPWFVGAVVFNLWLVVNLRNWFEQAEKKLLKSGKGRKKYDARRNDRRQHPQTYSTLGVGYVRLQMGAISMGT
jgi:hypothetical protein